MDKAALRNDMIDLLKNISEQEKVKIEKQLSEQLLNSSMWNEADVIGITVSQGFEWSTKPIIEFGWQQGKTIAVPKCIPSDKKMIFYQLDHFGQLESKYYNLLRAETRGDKGSSKVRN